MIDTLRDYCKIMLEKAERDKRTSEHGFYLGDGRWSFGEAIPERARSQGIADVCRIMLLKIKEDN